jgi:thymidine kinase
MFSGKTEELIRRLRRAQIANKDVKIFKPDIDKRYHAINIVSHNETNLPSIPVKSPAEILTLAQGADVVAIDEAQFFDNSIIEVCEELALSGIRIIIAGLDMDFQGKPFGPMPYLMAIAEYITKLHAICMVCGNIASHSYRKTAKTETVLLGEKDTYEARCRICFTKS